MPRIASKTFSALRQLAALGLPGRTIMPEVIRLLDRMAGFDAWACLYIDERGHLADALAPDIPVSVMSDYADNFYNRPHGDGVTGMTPVQAMASGKPVIQTGQLVDRKTLERTEFHGRILRPALAGWCLHIPLFDGDRPLCDLIVGRPLARSDFSRSSVRLVESAHAWLCHALASTRADASAESEASVAAGDEGMLILTAAGAIHSASPRTLTLLHQAADIPLHAAGLRRALHGDLGALLKKLSSAVGVGLSGAKGGLPAGTVRNRNGIFSLRAYALDAVGDGPGLVSVHIERRAPVSLRLFSAPRFLVLPKQEREVALRLLRGRSYPQTAADLGISQNSVVYYVRSLFQRLDIDGREQLAPALLGENG